MTPLKRRQFTQLAAAGLTSTIVADISSKALAQNNGKSEEVLYGVNLPSKSNALNREDETPSVELSTADMETQRLVSRTDVPAQSVDNPSSVRKKSRAFFTGDSDRITKLTALGDGNLVISTVSKTRNGYFNHLIYTVGGARNPQFRAKKVLELETADQTVESLLSLPKDQLLCLVGTEGVPPFAFKIIDSTSGKIRSGDDLALPPLPPNHRFANLCQDPKGNIFLTETSSEGIPILISMNLQEKAVVTGKVKIQRLTPLNFEGSPQINDVKDLNFSASGQLYALTTDKGGKNNALFTVDTKSGKMGLVREFPFEKFAFSV
ncbi:MAG: hypothetical protein KME28_10575 [Pelatocladus maniniholoensis HA4357-MV3]|uniref:Uncharacterized protein n=1 Tax=Pelatocladus maniniholoensis HA4357-MV3 TaxID=1117104 RepID=A0A9E3H7K0_9NOST|nr:hypothetical protein [Pelatocladus maniniholoensis HA4357-MV3]BAZ68244.1 hypothetical protein NIES4106_30050 [Fischerella sp. NIES-4106]